MKIGILTFHEGINHGGFFQAYSLLMAVKSLGHDAEIINYKNKIHYEKEKKAFLGVRVLIRRPWRYVSNFKKIKNFRRAQKSQMILSPKKVALQKEKLTKQYDIIIIGSDIVWNYQWDFLGNDPIYFGHGLNTDKLVAYAPSIGTIDTEILPEYVITGIPKIKSIGVRDEKTALLVKKILGNKPAIVLDPTFLFLPFGKEEDIKYKDYLLIYGNEFNQIQIQKIRAFSIANCLKIISIG